MIGENQAKSETAQKNQIAKQRSVKQKKVEKGQQAQGTIEALNTWEQNPNRETTLALVKELQDTFPQQKVYRFNKDGFGLQPDAGDITFQDTDSLSGMTDWGMELSENEAALASLMGFLQEEIPDLKSPARLLEPLEKDSHFFTQLQRFFGASQLTDGHLQEFAKMLAAVCQREGTKDLATILANKERPDWQIFLRNGQFKLNSDFQNAFIHLASAARGPDSAAA